LESDALLNLHYSHPNLCLNLGEVWAKIAADPVDLQDLAALVEKLEAMGVPTAEAITVLNTTIIMTM
jgi:hypothetical protein